MHWRWFKRVEVARGLKGFPYEYIEEDLSNKSQQLLEYNPVTENVPIPESYVFLEYIDETWNSATKILPEDPYERAKVRFWTSYIQQQLFEGMSRVVTSQGEAREKAREEVFARLEVFEEGMKEYLHGGDSFTNGESLELLDILMVATFGPYKAHEQVLGFKMLGPDRNPLLFSWVAAMEEHPVVKELDPPHDKLVQLLQFIKQTSHCDMISYCTSFLG